MKMTYKTLLSNIIFLFIIFLFQTCTTNQGAVIDYTQLEMKQIGDSKVAHLNGEKYTGQASYTLSNGVLQFQYTYKDGLQHGPYVTYYGNGNKQKEGTYNYGKQDGEYKEYYESGPLKYWYNWDNEKKVGEWKSFYENGGKWTLRNFQNDKLNGKLYVWDEQGRLGKEQTYVNGVQTEKINHFENF